jgi:hypothetical protein
MQINNIKKEDVKKIYSDAILNSYSHHIDIFDPKKHYNRSPSDIGFKEFLDMFSKEKFNHITIIYREARTDWEYEHWEFGLCNTSVYLNIKVSLKQAELIFKKYNLTYPKCKCNISNTEFVQMCDKCIDTIKLG